MAEPKINELMEKIVAVCKRRGFVYQSSEIYGGINGFWDYGPLGAELKRNVKDAWWRTMVHHRDDVSGLEATIIMHPQIRRASGHEDTFSDPMCDCLLTKKRFRADQVEPQSGVAYFYSGAESRLQEVKKQLNQEFIAEVQKCIQVAKAGGDATPHSKRVEELGKEMKKLQPKVASEATLLDDLIYVEDFTKRLSATHDPVAKALAKRLAGEAEERWEKVCESHDTFAVLISENDSPAKARRLAARFYESRGVLIPKLLGERTEKVENSQRFNPENGSLLTPPVPFNLMFKTYIGASEPAEEAYLRPETAQAIFAQFKNVLDTSRQKIPFGIAQVGKAFRNEVTPRNFTFRSREFEQMELEFFIKPDEAVEAVTGSVAKVSEDGWKGEPQSNWGWEVWHKYWVEQRIRFYEAIGLPRKDFVEYWQKPDELAHYARATVDILYKFPFSKRDANGELMGEELEGIAARSDFDLSQHERFSGKTMGVFDEELRTAWGKLDDAKKQTLSQRYYDARYKYLIKVGVAPEQAAREAKEDADGLAKGQYIPHVIEPSAGVDRLILALLCHAYSEVTTTDEKGKSETRVVMKFHPRIAPIKVGVFPLLKNKPELVKKAMEVRDLLRPHMTVFYDDGGAIGRRYARQDEAGTPFGVTIDFETLGEKPELLNTVTLRERDTMKQERIPISDLLAWLQARVR
jgi:glycyl-tRNA synthetase